MFFFLLLLECKSLSTLGLGIFCLILFYPIFLINVDIHSIKYYVWDLIVVQ